MKAVIVSIILSVFTLNVFSQKGKIEGQIRDASNNEPIGFAYVIINGTTIGAASDLDGKYVLANLDPGFYVLQISSVGYKTLLTQEVQVVGNKTVNLDFELEPQQLELEQVVVKADKFVKKSGKSCIYPQYWYIGDRKQCRCQSRHCKDYPELSGSSFIPGSQS